MLHDAKARTSVGRSSVARGSRSKERAASQAESRETSVTSVSAARRDVDAEWDVPEACVVEAGLPAAGERRERASQHQRRVGECELERAPKNLSPARVNISG